MIDYATAHRGQRERKRVDQRIMFERRVSWRERKCSVKICHKFNHDTEQCIKNPINQVNEVANWEGTNCEDGKEGMA